MLIPNFKWNRQSHKLVYLWIYLNQGNLTSCYFVFMGVMLIDLTPFRVGMLYSEQVKLSTKKLRQNKEKNKNSDFWNDNNEPPASWREIKFNLLFPVDWCDVMHDGHNVWWNQHHFSEREFDHEHATSSASKLRENEKDIKNSILKWLQCIVCASWSKIATLLFFHRSTDTTWCVARVDVLRETGNK